MFMKKYGLLLTCLIISMVAMSQKSVINFETKSHDFGKINEDDGKVTFEFDFSNVGNSPLVVSRVQASCGCTTPSWTKEPIEPGKKGTIDVTYNPSGRPGVFMKTITVYNNSTEEQVTLVIKGEVIPKSSGVSSEYPVVMSGLRLKTKVIQLNNVDKGKTQTRIVSIQNSSKDNLKITIANLPVYVVAEASPETLKPNEEGKITFTFNSKNCPQWGPVSDDVYVVLNGQKKYSDEYKLILVGNVVEDFDKLTLDQKRKSPILEIPGRSINLGTLKAGTKRVGKFFIKNNGQSALEIRRIINNNKELRVHPLKMTIAGGKKSDLKVDLNSKNLPEGEYKKSFTIQTNDPENSFLILVLSWKIVK